MVDHSISFARSASKELEALPNALIIRIIGKIEALSKTPRPPGCRKLQGSNHLWRNRVGEYRVVYSVDDRAKAVDIVTIRHRSQAYN
jgi:mRNA interferase RelE/StbE